MKVLVACEESQAVTIELRKLGIEAYSCDINPCSGGYPEWHLQQDVEPLLKQEWDMIIAFPPCTYLSNAGACRLYPTKRQLDIARYEKGLKAKEFFLSILNADCLRIAVENPVSSTVFNMPKHTQEIQPYMFGHPYTKKTRLWLKGLPELKPTNVVEPIGPYVPAGTGRKDRSKYGSAKRGEDAKNRSKTFPGIAKAMAKQWGSIIKEEEVTAMQDYESFISNKRTISLPTGFNEDNFHPSLFDFQRDLVRWALRRGRAAIFAGTGLGKTRMQIEWGQKVHQLSGGDVLLLAPLAVAMQTIREGAALGYELHFCRSQNDVKPGINVTNYEMLHHFEPILFDGVILDESSILKSFTGKIRTELIESFAYTPYRLACTATPAPNDYMEIGNHAEFLGVMSRSEMLSMFFVHDGGETQKWRLKGHAEDVFWRWVASWGVVLEKPSDLGYPDDQYILPPLTISDTVIDVDGEPAKTLSQRLKARRETVAERVAACAEIVNATNEPFLVWCDLNIESEMLTAAIPGAVQVTGSDKREHKERSMLDFSTGKIRVLVSKPSLCGFGMNWQHCANMAFVGLSDSFEQVFQAVRRCYRFGQTRPVQVHMITSSREGATAENIKRKEADFQKMVTEMIKYTKDITSESIRSAERDITEYKASTPIIIPAWLRSEFIAS